MKRWKTLKTALNIIEILTLKASITTAADDIFKKKKFWEKISFDISYESSAMQTIYMKYEDLFSMKKIQ